MISGCPFSCGIVGQTGAVRADISIKSFFTAVSGAAAHSQQQAGLGRFWREHRWEKQCHGALAAAAFCFVYSKSLQTALSDEPFEQSAAQHCFCVQQFVKQEDLFVVLLVFSDTRVFPYSLCYK